MLSQYLELPCAQGGKDAFACMVMHSKCTQLNTNSEAMLTLLSSSKDAPLRLAEPSQVDAVQKWVEGALHLKGISASGDF